MSDRQVLAKGVFWSAVEKYSSLVVSLLVSMVLARLLTPDEFGIVAIATVIIQFLNMLSNMGIAPAIVQRRDLSDDDLNSIFTFSCIVGLVSSLLLFWGSWSISSIYKNDALIPLCQILSIQVFFSAANMVPNALMTKDLRFKEIARRTLILQLTTGVISILAAVWGAGVFALLISPVFTSIGIFVYNRHYYKVKVSSCFSIKPLKKIFSYSSYQFLFQFIVFFSANIDKLLIGKYISASNLGYYQKSYQLVQQPLNSIGSVVNPVLQPVLTKYQDEKEELFRRYNKIIRLLSTICFPMGVLLFFCGSEIIRIFYGAQWDLAIPTFKIMTLTIPIQIILSSSGSFFLAGNETKKLFITGTINAIVTISLTIIAVVRFRTIESVAWAWNITNICGLFVTYYFMYVKVLQKPLYFVFQEFLLPLIVAVTTAIVLYIESIFFSDMFILGLLIKCITAALIALVSIQCTGQYDLFGLITKRLYKRE